MVLNGTEPHADSVLFGPCCFVGLNFFSEAAKMVGNCSNRNIGCFIDVQPLKRVLPDANLECRGMGFYLDNRRFYRHEVPSGIDYFQMS